MLTDAFISRWSESGDAERANKDSFLTELCDALGVERPHPKTGDPVPYSGNGSRPVRD